MGPRPDGRGRIFYLVVGFVVFLRQWGRGRMAAEGPANLTVAVGATGRQWGRGRMAAEGDRRSPGFSLARCVNGAAAGWPRKVTRAAGELADRQRQWGRGRMAAEGTTRRADGTDILASMGPRPDGRGRA